eukprot:gene20846-biopygen7078
MCSLTRASRCAHSRVRADVLTHGYEPMCSLTGTMPCGGYMQHWRMLPRPPSRQRARATILTTPAIPCPQARPD